VNFFKSVFLHSKKYVVAFTLIDFKILDIVLLDILLSLQISRIVKPSLIRFRIIFSSSVSVSMNSFISNSFVGLIAVSSSIISMIVHSSASAGVWFQVRGLGGSRRQGFVFRSSLRSI
jgi:hypothetical protein